MTRPCEDNSMNITFLIGNGFDIRLGLKTKFTDFYDTYIDLNKNNRNQIIREFCSALKKDNAKYKYANWSDFEAALPKYVKSEREIITILSDFTQKFYVYIQQLSYSRVETSNIEKFESFIFGGYINAVVPSDIKNIEEFFEDPVNEVNFINFNYTHTLSLLITLLMAQINKIEGNINRFFANELHIHGTSTESIIIGIDDVSELPYECAQIPYIGSYCVKRDMNTLLGNDKEIVYKDIISRSEIIIAYGLSFGSSDKSRWKELKNWIQDNKTHHTLVVYQYEPDFSDNKIGSLKAYIPEYIKKINEIKASFLIDKLSIDSKTAYDPKMLNRIVLIDSDKVLDFKLADDKEKQTT